MLLQRGIVARDRGDLAAARASMEQARTLWIDLALDASFFATLTSQNLASVCEDQHDYFRARQYLVESVALTRRTRNRWNAPFVLESAASLAATTGRRERALWLAGAAAALRERLGMPAPPTWLPRIERALERSRGALDPATAAADDPA